MNCCRVVSLYLITFHSVPIFVTLFWAPAVICLCLCVCICVYVFLSVSVSVPVRDWNRFVDKQVSVDLMVLTAG